MLPLIFFLWCHPRHDQAILDVCQVLSGTITRGWSQECTLNRPKALNFYNNPTVFDSSVTYVAFLDSILLFSRLRSAVHTCNAAFRALVYIQGDFKLNT